MLELTAHAPAAPWPLARAGPAHRARRRSVAPARVRRHAAHLAEAEVSPEDFTSRDLSKVAIPGKRNALKAREVSAYRAGSNRALAVQLDNLGTEPWTAAGVQLRGPGGAALPVLPLVQVEPIALGVTGGGW